MNFLHAKVYVLDDDAAVRCFLAKLLAKAGYHAETYEDPGEFLRNCDGFSPGCVLLDMQMPEMDGLEVQRRLVEKAVRLPVIFVSGDSDIPMAVEAMKQGAVEFIVKPFRTKALLDAVRKAFEFDASNREEAADELVFREQLASLTTKERAVLEQLVGGANAKDVADKMEVTRNAVDYHRRGIYRKLGVDSTTNLIRRVNGFLKKH